MSQNIEALPLEAVTPQLVDELKPLHDSAYHGSKMNEALAGDVAASPDVFRLFLARNDAGEIIGSRLVRSVAELEFIPGGCEPIFGKRFVVSPDARGQGVGKALLDAGKEFVFDELDKPVMFGQSNEIGALAMYRREGALMNTISIHQQFNRNHPDEAVKLFTDMLEQPKLRTLRLTGGDGIYFSYARDKELEATLGEHGYINLRPEAIQGLVSAAEIARLLGVSRQRVNTLHHKQGKLPPPATLINGEVPVWHMEDILEFMASRTVV